MLGFIFGMLSTLFSKFAMEKLENVGPNGEPMDIPSIWINILSSTLRKGTEVVHRNSSSLRSSLEMLGGGNDLWWYTFLMMMSIVSCTGTFVKRLSTSKELGGPLGLVVCSISMNSSRDFNIYSAGIYGLINSSNFFAVV